MTLVEYISEYGNYTFKEKKFNEVDALLFASLAYTDYKDVLNNPFKVPLSLVGKLILKNKTKKEINDSIPAIRSSLSNLSLMMDKPRYKDVKLYDYKYNFNKEMQYSSLCIDISEDETIISFEGTDELISGWYEDGELAFRFPVPAHKKAIKTVNERINKFTKRKYILVGHSKGGNLSLVAGMYAKNKNKIKKIYSFDGPGLRDEEFNSIEYANILDKYELIIPNYSIVGLLLNNAEKYKVIKSSYHGPYAHDLSSWEVEDDHLMKASLSNFSKKIDKAITKWTNNLSNFEREQFINDVFDVLKRANINTLYDLRGKNIKNIFKVINESKKIDVKSAEILKDMFKLLIDEIID